MRVKTVLHAHTDYSPDANTSCAALLETARRQGVDWVAITDHDEIAGALHARELGGVGVIVGEEISSADGHVIGLFLETRIPPGLSAEETAVQIRAQGGLVLAPHPFSTLCADRLGARLERLRGFFDAIEVCNAQNPFPWEDAQARRFAQRYGLTPYSGSDTHIRGYLAESYQLLPPFDGPAEFLTALQQAELHPGRFGPGYFAAMGVRHVWDKLFPRRLPGFGANVPASDVAGGARRPYIRASRGTRRTTALEQCPCDSR